QKGAAKALFETIVNEPVSKSIAGLMFEVCAHDYILQSGSKKFILTSLEDDSDAEEEARMDVDDEMEADEEEKGNDKPEQEETITAIKQLLNQDMTERDFQFGKEIGNDGVTYFRP